MFAPLTLPSHSFGSAQTYALANAYPHLTDGIVLAGFSTNGTFVPYFAAGSNLVQASTNQPFRFGDYAVGTPNVTNADGDFDYNAPPTPQPLNYPTGYLSNSNVGATQYLFFLPKYFDQGILFAGERTKQPVTPGELLTLPALVPVSAYTGPVLVFTGCKSLRLFFPFDPLPHPCDLPILKKPHKSSTAIPLSY